jgi:hypoxanthine phosphoribosyltransferase
MIRDIEKILITKEQIASRVHELGAQIAQDLLRDCPEAMEDGTRIVLVPILTGSVVFLADLVRELPMKLALGLVAVSSYPGASTESKGVHLRSEIPQNLGGKHVILIDDIFDSGQTIDVLTKLIAEQRPATLRSCVLLRKPGKAKVKAQPTYVGFDIPDEFVVGYGLDYDGFYRNYPQIATLRPEAR